MSLGLQENGIRVAQPAIVASLRCSPSCVCVAITLLDPGVLLLGDEKGHSPELADHAVDVPEAVGEHDAIVRRAVAVDVVLRRTQEAGGVHQPAPGAAVSFLSGLSPFTGKILSTSSYEPSYGDRGGISAISTHCENRLTA